MTNDVLDFGSGRPPRVPAKAVRKAAIDLVEPRITTGLKSLIDDLIPADCEYFVTRAADKDEAVIYACELEALCAAPMLGDVEAWLEPLCNCVSAIPEPEEFSGRLAAIWRAMGDLPVGVWTAETQVRAMRTFKFWPTVQELDELLRPIGENLRRRLRNAKRVAGGTLRRPLRAVTPEQERAYIQDVAEARRQRDETAIPAGIAPGASAEPVDMPSNDQLIAKYEQVVATARDPALVEQAKEILARLRAPSYALLAKQQLRELAEKRGLARPSGDASPALAPKESRGPEAGQAPTGA